MTVAYRWFASGLPFFIGAALIALATLWPRGKRVRLRRSLLRWTSLLVGIVLVIVSSTPLPMWVYALWLISTITALALLHRLDRSRRHAALLLRGACASIVLLAVTFELSWQLMPSVPIHDGQALCIIGDSLSGGLGEPPEALWPGILQNRHNTSVRNLARGGARLNDALKQVEKLDDTDNLVLLEIGGNDMLTPVSPEKFQGDLDRLLAAVCRPGRRVMMMELPLLPFGNGFGHAQRNLARQYGVTLIPKRVLAGVIATPGATVDGLHFSPSGHEMMAEAIWQVIQPH